MKKIFYASLLLLCSSFMYGFGEPPHDTQALQIKTIYPANLPALTDHSLTTATSYNFVILDIGRDEYLQDIKLYQTDLPAKLQTSSDGIGYDLVPTSAVTTVNPITYDLREFNGRYVRITNTATQNCAEIAITTLPDFRLTYVSINATPETNACTLYVKTKGKGYVQLLYGMNYDFIYYKTLPGIFSSLSMTNEEYIRITDLLPATTYRYQFKMRDLHGKVIESNYFTFTTQPVVK